MDSTVLGADITLGTEDTIYALGGSYPVKLYAINPNTGAEKWSYYPPKNVTYTRLLGTPTVGKDGNIYIYDEYGIIHAINPTGGSLVWRYIYSNGYYMAEGTMTVASDGTIYVFGDNLIALKGNHLNAINPDGSLKWRYQPEWMNKPGDVSVKALSPAIGTDGTIYIGIDNNGYGSGGLEALNPDGSLKWKYTTGVPPLLSPSVGPDGTIYVGTYNGFYAINPDGSLKWEFPRSGYYSVSASSIAADGTLYLMDDGTLYAFNSLDGSSKWQIGINNFTTYGLPSVTIDGNGTIYVGTSDYIYAINPDGSEKWNYYGGGASFSSPKIGSDGSLYAITGNSLWAFGP